ncbi:MAG TPA: choice-of-anchor Q domain-containing protein [Kiritimatiellia bacterium]|nr:choice-of-anchor Q domain-containing protein [Kiritimatiellia bacterium]
MFRSLFIEHLHAHDETFTISTMKAVVLLCVLLAFGTTTAGAFNTLYVSDTGLPGGIGTESDPFGTIQQGINAADPGDTVLVKAGVYRGPGNNNLSFAGKTIRLVAEDGALATILDGSEGPVGSGRAIELSHLDSTGIVIKGFTFLGFNSAVLATSGAPDEPYYSVQYDSHPSAIWCPPGSGATFESCRFIDNQAHTQWSSYTIAGDTEHVFAESAEGTDGGAIRIEGGHVVLSNCFFSGNRSARNGGAISVTSNGVLEAVDSVWEFNNADLQRIQRIVWVGLPGSSYFRQETSVEAETRGGAISFDNSVGRFLRCRFDDNRSGGGGAIAVQADAAILLEESTLANNHATMASSNHLSGGGALLLEQATATVTSCWLSNNRAWNGGYTEMITIGSPGDVFYRTETTLHEHGSGGAIAALSGSVLRLSGSAFTNNTAGDRGGALLLYACQTAEMEDCHFDENVSRSRGGAVHTESFTNELLVVATTFNENRAEPTTHKLTVVTIGQPGEPFFAQEITDEHSGGHGGALSVSNSVNISLQNAAFSGNRAGVGGAIFLTHVENAQLSHCRFEANAAYFNGGALHAESINASLLVDAADFIGNSTLPKSQTVMTSTIFHSDGDFSFLYEYTTREAFGRQGGGGMNLRDIADVSVRNTRMIGNIAGAGSGMTVADCPRVALSFIDATRNASEATCRQTLTVIRVPSEHYMASTNELSYAAGGVIALVNSAMTITNAQFYDNNGAGGAIVNAVSSRVAVTAALMRDSIAYEQQSFSMWSNTFSGAVTVSPPVITISNASAVALYESTGSIVHVTALRGGIIAERSDITALNAIVWDGMWEVDDESTSSVSYSIFNDIMPGPGNLTQNPLLTMTGRLRHDSPAIDAGIVISGITHDFDGEPFVGTAPDIGADEFVDDDNDLLADAWELEHSDSLETFDTNSDNDSDFATALEEYIASTQPTNAFTNSETIPDGWLLRHGLNPRLPQERFDHDGDTISTRDEYVADTSPVDALDYLAADIVLLPDDGAPYVTWSSRSQRWYRVESYSGAFDPWVALSPALAGDGLTTDYPLTATNEIAMLRIRVSLSPE